MAKIYGREKKSYMFVAFFGKTWKRRTKKRTDMSLLTDPQVVSHEVNFAVTTERTIHLTNVENIFLFVGVG